MFVYFFSRMPSAQTIKMPNSRNVMGSISVNSSSTWLDVFGGLPDGFWPLSMNPSQVQFHIVNTLAMPFRIKHEATNASNVQLTTNQISSASVLTSFLEPFQDWGHVVTPKMNFVIKLLCLAVKLLLGCDTATLYNDSNGWLICGRFAAGTE